MNATTLTSTYQLANGNQIPVIGFGTWQSEDGDQAYNAVKWALEAGYRHIDTAKIYDNEESVGKALRDSGINRSEIFITTKLWNTDRGSKENTLKAFDDSLNRLGLDYVDLYLIHWPEPAALRDRWQTANADDWAAIEDIYDQGRAKAIGVSNFRQTHIDELAKTQRIAPMVNQIFLNPGDSDSELVEYSKTKGMVVEAYSPLGLGELLNNSIIAQIADKLGKSPAQILVRWSLQKEFLPLPKSTHQEYIKANGEVFDFEISAEDMAILDTINGTTKQHTDPSTGNF